MNSLWVNGHSLMVGGHAMVSAVAIVDFERSARY
ncbi:MAG: hypothetical protein ACI81L_003379 [Verrucomicrobiales bacterium]|jgi:hypothetical protein